MAQMKMGESIQENLCKSLEYMERAKQKGADLIFFPEIQFSPFFPQFEKKDASAFLMELNHFAVEAICKKCRELNLYASPNLYLKCADSMFDASLFINPQGEIEGISKMVHIAQARYFYEQDYYTPSDTGFQVFKTPFGTIGIVICFDRHLPESMRTCAKKGADLILIPTANTRKEPMELFEWEIRVQAMHNGIYAAMCNRTGQEGDMLFAGESLVAAPDGSLVEKAGVSEQLLVVQLELEQPVCKRGKTDYKALLRPQMYQ